MEDQIDTLQGRNKSVEGTRRGGEMSHRGGRRIIVTSANHFPLVAKKLSHRRLIYREFSGQPCTLWLNEPLEPHRALSTSKNSTALCRPYKLIEAPNIPQTSKISCESASGHNINQAGYSLFPVERQSLKDLVLSTAAYHCCDDQRWLNHKLSNNRNSIYR